MCATNFQTSRRSQRGLSLVEVMVGVVVSMLVGLAAVGSARMFTASQRQNVGTGSTVVSASSAIGAIRDDVTAAGLGFFGDQKYLCSKLNLSAGTQVLFDGTAFTPLKITAETRGDRIDVISGSEVTAGANVLMAAAGNGASAPLRSLLPPPAGQTWPDQAVVLAPPVAGLPCTVRSVTTNTAATAFAPQTLQFASSGAHNQASFTTNVTYPVGTNTNTYSRVALLGKLNWSRYRVSGTDLVLERPLAGSPAAVLVRNVMAFRTQIGFTDVAGGQTVTSWQDVSGSPITDSLLPLVRAVRIGVVTRSDQADKPKAGDPDGKCYSVNAKPTLFTNTAIEPDVSNWDCYRYRTTIMVVPIRNVVMGSP